MASGSLSVAALVPAWNSAGFLERTLHAVASQTHRNLQILISDDASTDGTYALCERFAASDPRVRVVRQKRNRGWVRNTNSLLPLVEADYLFFAFHDDVPRADYVERLVARLEANPDASLAYSDVEVRGESGVERLGYSRIGAIRGRLERARTLIRRDANWWLPMHGVFRTSAVRRSGGLRTHLGGEFSADWPWLVRMALLGSFERDEEALCTKHRRKGSVADGWQFAPRYWYAAALSCASGLAGMGLQGREMGVLLTDLGRFCLERRRESAAWMAVRREEE